MPWLSSRELVRLERDLETALRRAEEAENRLVAERERLDGLVASERERLDGLVASERQGKDWLTIQLASRVVTKHGGYGLDHELPAKLESQPLHPKGFIREPTEIDLVRLEMYKKWAKEAGVDNAEDDAQARWEAEMRGETVAYTDSEQ